MGSFATLRRFAFSASIFDALDLLFVFEAQVEVPAIEDRGSTDRRARTALRLAVLFLACCRPCD
eukprot:5541900-Pleurochrysis_carterae.AAC.1